MLFCSGGRRSNQNYGYANAGPRIWFSPLDVFWYWDPYYTRRRRMRQEAGQGMNFLEAIFSFVFGDGNPNESFDDRRWRLVSAAVCMLRCLLNVAGSCLCRHSLLAGKHISAGLLSV